MSLDLAIVNGTVVDEHGSRVADIGVCDGQVVLLAAPHTLPPANETIDATDLWILPGIVDAHFHCRAPDHPEREDFASGTAAAAAGGITTLFEMPIAAVGVSRPEVFRDRATLVEQDAHIDVALFAGCGSLDRAVVQGLAAAGAIGYKIFMHTAPVGRERQFEGLCVVNEHDLFRALTLVQETGLPCALHAENDALMRLGRQTALERGLTETEVYQAAHHPSVEALAVSTVAVVAEATGAHAHIVHVTSAWAVDVIRAAQRRGVSLTAETCPQYLLFDETDAQRHGAWAKIAPPIRTAADQQALWDALADGTLAFIASDHAPFTKADKETASFLAAPSGVTNIEAMVPLMLSAALEGRLPFSQMVGLLTAKPARTYGIYPRKGALQPGSDADIMLFDPRPTTTITTRNWFSRSRDSARLFDGMTHRGRILRTLVRGRTVYHDGQLLSKRGWGRLVRPRDKMTG